MFQLRWFYQIHVYIIIIGVIALLASVYIIRFKKDKPWRIKRHKMLALISVVSILLGVILMFIGKENLDLKHFNLPHHYGGALALVMLIVTPLLAYIAMKGKASLFKVHRWFGRITFVLTLLASLFGTILLLSYI